jgi:hypothetical protein
MKGKYLHTMKFLLIFFIFANSVLASQTIQDPGFQDGEFARYKITIGEEIEFSTQTIKVQNDSYAIETETELSKQLTLLNRDNLFPYLIERSERVNGSEFTSRTEVLKNPQITSDEVFIMEIGDLIHVLRGYPFEDPRTLRIHVLGQDAEEGNFSLDVKFRRTENIDVNGKRYRAYKLELVANIGGPFSLFAGFFPKTFFWYSEESPHILLKYEGTGGFGEEGKRIVELLETNV